jgi:hypothetical protein
LKLDLFPSSGRGGETPTQLGLLERANLNHWTTYVTITTTIYIPEIRVCQQEVTGKCTIKIVIMHVQT